MIVLGIDPGTHCGWALLGIGGSRLASGVWDLSTRRHEGGGMRYLRFRNYFTEALSVGGQQVGAVAYEEVRRHMGTDAAHVYGGIVAQLTAVAEELSIPYRAIPVGTIKKLATGKGNASKDMMLAAARQRWPSAELKRDDEADALFVGFSLQQELSAA